MFLLQTHKTPFLASKNVSPGVDICYLVERRREMSFSVVSTFFISVFEVAPKNIPAVGSGGFEGGGPLTCSVVHGFGKRSSKESISQTS